MASLWNDVKKNLGEWASKAAGKAAEFSRDAADKAEELTKLGKVKLDIFQTNREVEKQFTKLGGIVYDLISDKKTNIEADEKVAASVKVIQNLEKALRGKENEYKNIKEKSVSEEKAEKKEEPETKKKTTKNKK